MKSSIGIYVVITTIFTIVASAYPYAKYSSQPQNYFGPNQWNIPQSQHTNHVQPGYFQQPTQDWGSRGYQPHSYDPNLYSPSPAPPIHQPSLGYPGLPRQSTSNAYGSSMTAAGDYPQMLPQQSQSKGIENSDDQSKFRILHVPLPTSDHTKTIKLPITGDSSKFRIVHVNPKGVMSDVKPSRSVDDVSNNALNALSRIKSELEQIASYPKSYRETDYLTGNQQSPKQTTSYGHAEASSGSNSYGNQGVPYNSGKTYPQSYGNLDGTYTQGGVSNSNAQADTSSSSGDSYPINTPNYKNQGGLSYQPGTDDRVAQGTTSASTGSRIPAKANNGYGSYAQADASSNSGGSYPISIPNYKEQGGAPYQPGTDDRVAQGTASASAGSRSPAKANNGYGTYAQADASSSSGDSYPINIPNNKNQGRVSYQPGTDDRVVQGTTSAATGSRIPAKVNNGYGSYAQADASSSSGDSYPINIPNYKNQGRVSYQPGTDDRVVQGTTSASTGSRIPAKVNNGYGSYAQADASSSSGDSYPINTPNYKYQGGVSYQPGTDDRVAQGTTSASTGSRIPAKANNGSGSYAQADASSNSGDSYPISIPNYKKQGGAPYQPGTDDKVTQVTASASSDSRSPAKENNGYGSYAQADASSNSGDSYPISTPNYKNPSHQTGTDIRFAQGSAASGSRSPARANDGDESYPTNKESYGNQGGVYANAKPYSNSNNNQQDSEKQDVYPKNGKSYPVNNNGQDYGNKDVSPDNDETYPIINKDWTGPDNYGGSPDSGKPNHAGIKNLPGSRTDGQPPISGESNRPNNSKGKALVSQSGSPISGESYFPNNSNGKAPVSQYESPSNAKTHTLPIHHYHNSVSTPSKHTSTSTAQASEAAASDGGTTRTPSIAPHNRHHYYPHNSPHRRPHDSPSTDLSLSSSQAAASASGSSASQNSESNEPENNQQVHGGSPTIPTSPPNSNKPTTYKIPIRGGPSKFNHRTTQSPKSNKPAHKNPANGDSSNIQPKNSENTQPQLTDSDKALSKDQYGIPNNPLEPQYGPTDDGFSGLVNNPQDLSDSSVPVDDGTEPNLSSTENIDAPTDSLSSGLIPSLSSLVPVDSGTSAPMDSLPDAGDGGSKNTQPDSSDSRVSSYINPSNDGIDSSGAQGITTEPYKLSNPTVSQDDGNSSTDDKSDGTDISYSDESIENSQASSDYSRLLSSDSISSSKGTTDTLSDKMTVPKNTQDGSNKADNVSGLLVTDSLESFIPTDTATNGKHTPTNPTKKKTNFSSLFKRIFDKTKKKLFAISAPTKPTETPKPTNNDKPDDSSLDLDALLKLDKNTKNKKNASKNLEYLGINKDNLDEDDAGHPENEIFADPLDQAEAAVLQVSKNVNLTSSSEDEETSYQVESGDSSHHSAALRVLLKIIVALEKLLGGKE